MTFADHFSGHAARYATYRPSYPPALVDALADRCRAHELAWDVGCGNGQLSIPLAARFARVIATDPAQAQLAAAPPHPRVAYRCAPAEASGLPDACADLVVAAQAAHWFDWPRFVAEAGRVAKPGAVVALVCYGNVIVDGDAGHEIARYYADDTGPYWPAPGRELIERGYRDLVLPWPTVDAPAIELTMTWTRDELVGYVSTWSGTTRMIADRGPAPFEAFAARMAACWPDGERRAVRWPLTIKLARR